MAVLPFLIFPLVLAQTSMERQLASAAGQALRAQTVALQGQEESLRAQQASVRRQVQMAPAAPESFFVTAFPITADPSASEREAIVQDCAPLSEFEAQGLIAGAARKAGVDANLLRAVARQESAFKPCAVSAKGAQGLMQLMPATALGLGVKNPFDAQESLDGGAALLKQLILRYSGDLNRVLGAYNAGPARVDAANGVPAIPETLDYVEKVLGRMP